MTPDVKTIAIAIAYGDLIDRAARNLSQVELLLIAYAAATNLNPIPLDVLLNRITPVEYPGPPVPFGSLMDCAIDWAVCATPAAREAWALAAFDAMPSARKVAFLNHVMAAAT